MLGEVGDAHQQQRKALTGDGPAFAATVLLVAAVFAFVAADGPQTTAFAPLPPIGAAASAHTFMPRPCPRSKTRGDTGGHSSQLFNDKK